MPSKNAESDDEETIDKEEQEEGSDEVRLILSDLRTYSAGVAWECDGKRQTDGRGRLTWHGHLESMLIM